MIFKSAFLLHLTLNSIIFRRAAGLASPSTFQIEI